MGWNSGTQRGVGGLGSESLAWLGHCCTYFSVTRPHLLSLSFSSACSFVKTIPCADLDNPGHAGNSLRGCGSGQVSERGSKEHTGLSRKRLYWQGGREDCRRESCDLRSAVCPGLDTKGLPFIGQTGQS